MQDSDSGQLAWIEWAGWQLVLVDFSEEESCQMLDEIMRLNGSPDRAEWAN